MLATAVQRPPKQKTSPVPTGRRGGHAARLAVLFFLALASSLIAIACTLFNPLDEYGPPKPRDGSVTTNDSGDGAVSSSGGDDGGCTKVHPPGPSGKDEPGEPPPEELVFALATLDVAEDAGGVPNTPGYDLDNACTCAPDAPTCVNSAPVAAACDADGGVDNGGTNLLTKLVAIGGTDLDFTSSFSSGERGVLLRLRKYNGGHNDPEVELAVMMSGGHRGIETGTPDVPKHDGTDEWTIDPSWLLGGGVNGPPYVPIYVNTKAYVVDDTIVSINTPYPLRLSQLNMNLTNMMVTARIVRDGSLYRLVQGRIAGRWATKELLTTVETLRDKSQPKNPDGGLDPGICGESSLYKTLKGLVCEAVDLTSDPKLDKTNAPCDALAVTMAFSADPASIAGLFPMDERKRRCGDAWEDDCTTK